MSQEARWPEQQQNRNVIYTLVQPKAITDGIKTGGHCYIPHLSDLCEGCKEEPAGRRGLQMNAM